MVEKILNNTTPYGKIRASHEGSLHSFTLNDHLHNADNDHSFRSRGTKKSVNYDQPRPTAYVPHCHSVRQTVTLVANHPNYN